MEKLIDWHIILQLGPIVLMGLLVHLLDKWDSAKKKEIYTPEKFWKDNLNSYIIAIILCMVGLAFMGNSIELVNGNAKIVIAFTLGYSGGSIVRSFITKNIPK